jgi:prefoldin subunit 5
MAKPPSKRRGISLGATAETAGASELLNAQPAASAPIDPDGPVPQPGSQGSEPYPAEETAAEGLAQLRSDYTDLDRRFREQLELLDEQRQRIAVQARQLQTLERQATRSAGRVGVLLALLALAAVGALGYYTWPELQHMQSDLSKTHAKVTQLTPQVQAVRGDLSSLASNLGEITTAVACLRQGSTATPKPRGAAQAETGPAPAAAQTAPANPTNPYWAVRPMLPW